MARPTFAPAVLVLALLAATALVVVTASPSPSALAKRQLIPDTCNDKLGFTAPKQGDTWTTFSKVTVSWTKPPGAEHDPLSVLLMRRNTSDPMMANRLMSNSLFEINANLPPTETSVTTEFKLPEGKALEKGGDYFVRVMFTKKGSNDPQYSCSPYFNVEIGKPSSAGKVVASASTAVAMVSAVMALLL